MKKKKSLRIKRVWGLNRMAHMFDRAERLKFDWNKLHQVFQLEAPDLTPASGVDLDGGLAVVAMKASVK